MNEVDTLELESGDIKYACDINLAEVVLQQVTEAYLSARLIYGSEKNHSEERFLQLLSEKENEYPGITLNGLFLITSLTFSGSIDVLFKHLIEPSLFEQNLWLFIPQKVVERKEEECIEALKVYAKPTGTTGKSIMEWYHNSKHLLERYDGQIANLFFECDGNALRIIPEIMGGKERQKSKEDFRRYGTKLATLFLLWVDQYKLYDFENIDSIGIPIDRHVRRFLIKTGILVPFDEIPIYNYSYDLALPILKEVVTHLTNKGYKAWQVMNAIWGISTNECRKGLHNNCPLNESCTRINHIERKTRIIPNFQTV
ncbi:MAG: hypothetical protein AB9915_02890 [Candidatus Dojkabacteria bacterium]